VLRILLNRAPIEENDEEKPGVILDYDKNGNVVGMKILDASQRVENPRGMEYAITSEPVYTVSEKPFGKYGEQVL